MDKQIIDRLKRLGLSNKAIASVATMYDNGEIIDVDIFDTNDEPFDIDEIDSYELLEPVSEQNSNYYGGKEINFGGYLTYLVFANEFLAKSAAKEKIEEVIDEKGLSIINPATIDIEDYIDKDWFEDYYREEFTDYYNDMSDEEDTKFGNALVRECYNKKLIDDTDFYEDEEYNPIYSECRLSINSLVENLVDDAISNMDDLVKAYVDDNGEVKFEDTLLRENLIDMNDLCEDLVKSDGIGHYLAEYDGKDNEYKLSGIKYYLYRI